MEPARVSATELADWALSHGHGALTTGEIAGLLRIPSDQVRRRLHAPARRGQWVSPTRGLWVPVPPEFRTWGAPPGIEIIDAIMDHRGARYYVGWLSAAALHGASHQAPQVFQVAVSRHLRNLRAGRTRFVFMQREVSFVPVVDFPTRSGTASVSTVEATMLDVATDIVIAGGLDNVATVILDLADSNKFNVAELARLAPAYPASSGRRIGYLLHRLGGVDGLEPLRKAVADAAKTPSLLDPSAAAIGATDEVWMIRENREVEEESS